MLTGRNVMIKKIALKGLIFLTFICLSGCNIFETAVQISVKQTQDNLESMSTEATNTRSSVIKPTSKIKPTTIKIRTPTKEPCTRASSVTNGQKGQTIEVCGKVTYAGQETCPECPNGYYAYLVLNKSFYIISYEWVFDSGWIGDCILVKDEVETMGSKPIFVFGLKEGYGGSKCERLADGTLSCREGDYFQGYSGCK